MALEETLKKEFKLIDDEANLKKKEVKFIVDLVNSNYKEYSSVFYPIITENYIVECVGKSPEEIHSFSADEYLETNFYKEVKKMIKDLERHACNFFEIRAYNKNNVTPDIKLELAEYFEPQHCESPKRLTEKGINLINSYLQTMGYASSIEERKNRMEKTLMDSIDKVNNKE